MIDFSNLQAFDVKPDTSVRYDITDIRMGDNKIPYLMVRPATEANKPFARAQLLGSNKRVRANAGRGVSLETIQDTRDDDRRLYPRFVVESWGNVYDTAGHEVPFSMKSCEEFMAALPNHVFDNVRAFCSNPLNFADIHSEDDDEAVGN